MTEVTQADRSAYESYIRRINGAETDEAVIERLHHGEMDGNHGVQIAAIARLAERERCAAIAEMHDHRGDIATAIRKPHP